MKRYRFSILILTAAMLVADWARAQSAMELSPTLGEWKMHKTNFFSGSIRRDLNRNEWFKLLKIEVSDLANPNFEIDRRTRWP